MDGVKLRDENGGGWEIKQVVYADDTALVAETRVHIVNEFERGCDSMGLKINVWSKVLKIKNDQIGSFERVKVNR